MSDRKSLFELYAEHVGKSAEKWKSYLQVYGQILSPYRDKSICLLEIGVQNGGSLEIWAKYFSHHAQQIAAPHQEIEALNRSFLNRALPIF